MGKERDIFKRILSTGKGEDMYPGITSAEDRRLYQKALDTIEGMERELNVYGRETY